MQQIEEILSKMQSQRHAPHKVKYWPGKKNWSQKEIDYKDIIGEGEEWRPLL